MLFYKHKVSANAFAETKCLHNYFAQMTFINSFKASSKFDSNLY